MWPSSLHRQYHLEGCPSVKLGEEVQGQVVGCAEEPKGELKAAIEKDFGSLDEFKKQFKAAGATQFGSGWAWLVLEGGQLKVTKTPNAENPLPEPNQVRRGLVILSSAVITVFVSPTFYLIMESSTERPSFPGHALCTGS